MSLSGSGHGIAIAFPLTQNPAVAERAAVANIDDRYTMAAKRTTELLGDRGQQQVLAVAFDDNERAGEEQVGLGRVEEATKELIVVGCEPGMGRAQRKGAVTDDHRHGLKLGTGRELRAMGSEEDLDLLMGLALVGVRLGGAGRKHFHEERLVLGMQMRFRLLDQQKRHLIGMRLEQQQLGRHKQQVVIAQPALDALSARFGIQIEFEPLENLIKRAASAEVQRGDKASSTNDSLSRKSVLTLPATPPTAALFRTAASAAVSVSWSVALAPSAAGLL